MFLWDWSAKVKRWLVSDILHYYGFAKKAKILLLGLDNAGKTSLLTMLLIEQLRENQPTQHPIARELTIGGTSVKVFDLGGHEIARRAWNDYSAGANAIVFVVDANDRDRFPEASNELNKLLNTEQLDKVPILILGNKIDKPFAASEEELKYSLRIDTTGKTRLELEDDIRPIEVFMCSFSKRMGYGDGFRWLTNFI